MPDQPFRYGEPPPVQLSSQHRTDGQTGKYYAPYPHQKRLIDSLPAHFQRLALHFLPPAITMGTGHRQQSVPIFIST